MKLRIDRTCAMKRFMLFSFLGFLILLASVKPVDGHELGIKAGVSHSRVGIYGEIPWITFKAIQDFSTGICLSLDIFGDRIGLQPEVNYTIKGFGVREMDGAEEIFSKYKISYLEFPVLVYHKIPLRGKIKPKLFMGPYLGLP
jgi:hypothetical protein